jgi:predicted permease
MLARNRLATAVAVLSLGLGIGANVANFSIVYGLLFRALPFADGDRLLYVDAWNPDRGDGDAPLTWADLDAMRGLDAFDAVGALSTRSLTLTGGERPELVHGASVTPGLFELLGAQPAAGRAFAEDEGAEAGFEQVAILSDALWKRRYGADPGIVGDTIHLNGREIAVIGIMPPAFRFPEREDLWLPLGTDSPADRSRRYLTGIARLRDGATLAAARQQLDAWVDRAAIDFPRTHAGWDVRAQWFRHGFFDARTRAALYSAFAAVAFVLLLACANVANLMLARATDVRRDLVVRSALGASRLRLARQVLTESVLLGVAGGLLGVVVAWLWVDTTSRAIPEEMAHWVRIGVDRPALLYALLIAVGTGLLFGMLPALQASRAGRGVPGGRSILGAGDGGAAGRWRSALVSLEVALSIVLLVSATLMVRSFMELQTADPGFDDAPLLSLRIVQAGDHYDDPAARARYWEQAAARLGELPGAVSAVATGSIPADDGGAAVSVLPEGATEGEELWATAVPSTSGLFATLGIEPLAGRDFTAAEALDPESGVAIVGARLAARLWPSGGVGAAGGGGNFASAVGRRLELPEVGSFRVIGIVPDLQYEEFGEDGEAARLQVHLPYAVSGWRGMSILVRAAAGDPATLTAAVRDELARLDGTLAPYDIMTMRERRAYTTWPQHLFGQSFAAFAAIALVLSVSGIYGVIGYAVGRRTREIGLRMALGARPAGVVGAVVGRALKLAAIGAAAGLLAALAFARALESILYGVSTTDPTLYASVLAVILLAAAAAAYLPARRASAVDPTEALRAD